MQMLIHVKLPHKEFNAAIRDGSAGRNLKRIIEETRPKAVYFTEYNGQRGAVMITDLASPSDVPRLAEPWFLLFNADVEFHIAMSPEQLEEAGLEAIAEKWL